MTDATIALKVDTKGLKAGQQEIDKLGRKGKEVETSLGKSTQNLNNKWSTSTKAIAGVTSALVAMGAVKVFTNAIKTTAEFSQSIADLSAITGATGKDLEFYSKQAAEIGRTTSLSASQAATAFKLIASAKPELLESAESLAAVTKEAVTLAEATGSSLPEAASALGSALNQFQLPASDANRVINALAASSQLGTAEVGAVTEAMRNAGSAANSLGLDFEETVAGIQALAASGRQGADAGTALRQVLLQLESTADKDLMPSLVGLDGALQELATRNLDNTQLMDLFGKEAFTAAASLLAQKDIVTDLNVSLRDTSTATDQAAIRMDTFSGDVLSLKSAIEGLQIEAFSSGLDGLGRSAVQTATGGINLLTENLDHVGSAAKVLATILTVRMIPDLALTVTRMVAAATATGQLGGALTLLGGPVGIAALAAGSVVALAMAFKSLREEQERARKSAASYISGNGGLQSIDLAIIGTQKEIERLRQVIKDDNGIFSHFVGSQSNKARDRIKELESFLADLKREHEALSSQQVETTETTSVLTETTNVLTEAQLQAQIATAELTRLTEEQTRESERVAQAISKQIMELNTEFVSLQLTSRQQAIFNAELKAFNDGAAPEAIKKIGELAGRNYDLEQSQKDATSASKELAKETTTSTRSMETDLGRLGNTAVDTFAQMLVSGGDAMDGLKRVFENAIADMVSKFLKSGLADLFDGGNFTFGIGGGGSGGGSSASLLSGGSNLLGLAGLGGSVTGFLSGAFGTATGVAAGTVGPPTAAAMAGSGMMASVGAFLTSPVGIAAAALLAGKLIHDKTSNPDGYIRSSAGFLTAPTPGAKPGQTFAVDPFASGFNPIGFSDKKSREEAIASINVFRDLDKTITDLVVGAGGFVDLSKATLGGFGEDGVAGTSGTFLGLGGKTTESDLAAMANSYARQLANHIQGLTPEAMAQIMGAGSAAEIMKALEELSTANTTAADETTAADNANTEATTTAAEEMDTLSKILEVLPNNIRNQIQEAFLELQGIEEVNGLLFDSNGSLVDINGQVIASQAELNETLASLPPLLQQAISQVMNPVVEAVATETTKTNPYQDIINDPAAWGKTQAENIAKINAQQEMQYGQNVLDALIQNPSAQGFANFAQLYPNAFEELGVRQMLTDFERITGTNISEGGLEAYAMVRDATGMSLEEYAKQRQINLGIHGSHASGLNSVPFDGYLAELHKGERVKTASEARQEDSMASMMGDLKVQIVKNTQLMLSIVQRWDFDGLPATRT